MGRKCVDSNQLFIDNLRPVEDRIGEEGKGFSYILHGLNPERILITAEGCRPGAGRALLGRRLRQGREVFDRPIGRTRASGIPLARSWMELEAAHLMVRRRSGSTTNSNRAARK